MNCDCDLASDACGVKTLRVIKLLMISHISGEVIFQDLRILQQAILSLLGREHRLAGVPRTLPVPGWMAQQLGGHRSELGVFDVEVLSHHGRIQVLLLAHVHPFYERNTPGDAERRAFHEGIISSELAGQREFSWGEVLCRLDTHANKDWLVLAYNQGPHVPLATPEVLLHLHGHQPCPKAA